MTLTVQELITLTYALLASAAAIGLGVANFRVGRSKAQAADSSAQRDAIEAMQAQINTQKDTITELSNRVTQQEAKIDALETTNRLLTDLLQGRPEWAVISQSLETINQVAKAAPAWREEQQVRDQAILQAISDLKRSA